MSGQCEEFLAAKREVKKRKYFEDKERAYWLYLWDKDTSFLSSGKEKARLLAAMQQEERHARQKRHVSSEGLPHFRRPHAPSSHLLPMPMLVRHALSEAEREVAYLYSGGGLTLAEEAAKYSLSSRLMACYEVSFRRCKGNGRHAQVSSMRGRMRRDISHVHWQSAEATRQLHALIDAAADKFYAH